MNRMLRRLVSEVLGWLLAVVGLVLMMPGVPGPGLILFVAGIALLAQHYAWARRILDPLHDRAVEAAKRGVETKKRISMSLAGVLWLVALGAVWLLSPPIPEFTLWGWEIGPRLPGGSAAGVGLITSGVAGGALLAYSVKRWYPGSESSDR
jgi:hypothetical protein